MFDQRYAVRSLGSPPTTHPRLLDSAPFRTNAALVNSVVLPEGHDVHSSRLFSSPSCYLQLFYVLFLSIARVYYPSFVPSSSLCFSLTASISPERQPHSSLFYQTGTQRAQKQFALEWPRNIMKLHPLPATSWRETFCSIKQ